MYRNLKCSIAFTTAILSLALGIHACGTGLENRNSSLHGEEDPFPFSQTTDPSYLLDESDYGDLTEKESVAAYKQVLATVSVIGLAGLSIYLTGSNRLPSFLSKNVDALVRKYNTDVSSRIDKFIETLSPEDRHTVAVLRTGNPVPKPFQELLNWSPTRIASLRAAFEPNFLKNNPSFLDKLIFENKKNLRAVQAIQGENKKILDQTSNLTGSESVNELLTKLKESSRRLSELEAYFVNNIEALTNAKKKIAADRGRGGHVKRSGREFWEEVSLDPVIFLMVWL